MLSEETRERILGYLPRYRTKRAAILPALWAAQDELGWLNAEAYEEVGELLDMHPTDVAAIASFYTMFHKQPMGKHVIEVCSNLSCELRGASEILKHLRHELGIQDGQTTEDGKFSLRHQECPCYCEFAPVMQINTETYGNVTPELIDRILADLRAGRSALDGAVHGPDSAARAAKVPLDEGGGEEQAEHADV
ncbi:MAG: NADH-quinone oxidoreductase subunit NuoE [Dehalococcoidia bacterium]|nr:NADH-quinone oxidoreductase subunit NuoE [Dehalococcoidia bacterium]